MSAISVSPPVVVNRSATQLGQQVVADSNNVSREPTLLTAPSAVSGNASVVSTANSGSESVRVSSSIGRAASAGQLSRQEALDIYRQIASLL
jgi:hypothetical protein